MTNPEVKFQIIGQRDKMAIPPSAVGRAIAFAIEQPADVDVTAQVWLVLRWFTAILPVMAMASKPNGT